jgi:archaellum biogenesis protein FlaJ (TadC family)
MWHRDFAEAVGLVADRVDVSRRNFLGQFSDNLMAAALT